MVSGRFLRGNEPSLGPVVGKSRPSVDCGNDFERRPPVTGGVLAGPMSGNKPDADDDSAGRASDGDGGFWRLELALALGSLTRDGSGREVASAPATVRSSRLVKENVEPIDPVQVLAGVRDLDVATWNYADQDPSIRHMGPMAEDFHRQFELGRDSEHIAGVDVDGVALGAIQRLGQRLDYQRELIATQQETIETQRAYLEAQRDDLAECKSRLDVLEAEVANEDDRSSRS